MLVDGVDVRDLDPEALWRRIGLVPQKPYLFSGTVASNLRYGNPDATDERAVGRRWRSPRPATSSRPCPRAWTPPIAQGGTNVSGGQRQRLAIARALVRQARRSTCSTTRSPRSTSPPTPGCGRRCAPHTREATVVIVAQRVSTIADADQIIVLEDGGIVGIGTHDELLETCPTYAEIVESQLAAGGGGMSAHQRPAPAPARAAPPAAGGGAGRAAARWAAWACRPRSR